MSFGSCALCGDEILESDLRDAHDQTVGWRLRRKAGKDKYPRKTGAVAHGRCVDDAHAKQKRGVPVKQIGLF